MKKIYLLCDYLGRFSSKWGSMPYRSGMDKSAIKINFYNKGYKAIFLNYPDVNFSNKFTDGDYFLYTSSEDLNLYYKSYIEDIVLGLEVKGVNVIPPYIYLKAHHNKVFMEILRKVLLNHIDHKIDSLCFGTLEELSNFKKFRQEYPVVVKSASGACSKGVFRAQNSSQLYSIAKKISYSPNICYDAWDFGRKFKHTGYMTESRNRRKFIVQSFISSMPIDWKILIFGNKYYILERKTRKNDFRASGSGLLSYPDNIPDGLLDFSMSIYNRLNIPFLSLDIGYDGNEFHLIEFQAVYFGTHTLETSPFYYQQDGNGFKKIFSSSVLEEVFVDSVIQHICFKRN